MKYNLISRLSIRIFQIKQHLRRLKILYPVGLCLLGVHYPVFSEEPIKPIPETVEVDFEKVELGKRLFNDTLLSKDNTVSCASCHNLATGGDDDRPVSVGIDGKEGPINAPTVFNSGLNFKQFWDGRASTLADQVDGPIQNEVEMGSIWPEIVAKLYKNDFYSKEFKKIYPQEGISRNTVRDAIAEFEKTLITPNSPFDLWLRGSKNAINTQQKRGYELFKSYGCTSCHQGTNVGGNMFQVFGVLNSYFLERGNITEADMGRYNITGNPSDKHAFKVPSLRMAAHTAPYFHDGSAKTLREAVDVMFKFQLGREAPDQDKDDIVEFIKSLAGTYTAVTK